jgi:hypothetical protein
MWPKRQQSTNGLNFELKINLLKFPSVKVSEILLVYREYLVEDYIKKIRGGGEVINSVFEILREN